MNKQIKIVKLKERNLLIKSDVIEKYPDFKSLLLRYKTVSEQMVMECVDMDKNTQELLQTSAITEIYKAAKSEWVAEINHDIDDKRCMLCNHKNNQIFYIRNIINGESLNVGSECVKYFENSEQVISDRKELDKVIQRRIKFDKRFSNLSNKLFRFESDINNSPYIVNFSSFYNATKLIEEIKKFKAEYIDGKRLASCFNDIDDKLKRLERITSVDIPNKNKELKNKKYVCTKEVLNWLLNSNKDRALADSIVRKVRINNSCFDADTITEITYVPFIYEYFQEYKEIIQVEFDIIYDIRMYTEAGFTKFYVNLNTPNLKLKNITFCITIETFMKEFGSIVMLNSKEIKSYKKRFSLSFLFSNLLLLYNDENNIFSLYSLLSEKYRGDFEFMFDYDLKTSYIIDKNNILYTKFNGTRIVVKGLLKFLNEENNDKAKNYFFSRLRWTKITEDMQETLNECRREFNNTQIAYY